MMTENEFRMNLAKVISETMMVSQIQYLHQHGPENWLDDRANVEKAVQSLKDGFSAEFDDILKRSLELMKLDMDKFAVDTIKLWCVDVGIRSAKKLLEGEKVEGHRDSRDSLQRIAQPSGAGESEEPQGGD